MSDGHYMIFNFTLGKEKRKRKTTPITYRYSTDLEKGKSFAKMVKNFGPKG